MTQKVKTDKVVGKVNAATMIFTICGKLYVSVFPASQYQLFLRRRLLVTKTSLLFRIEHTICSVSLEKSHVLTL